jgi:hypothetical protein
MPQDTKRVGNVSEAAVLAALLKRGYVVLTPWGDNERYDLVIDNEGTFERVQVKTGRIISGAVVVDAKSVSTKGTNWYHGQVDHIAAYCTELDKCYLVPMVVFGKRRSISLRFEASKNHQSKRVTLAKDFEL